MKFEEDKMVKELLKDYKVNKARIAVANKDDKKISKLIRKIKFLDKCIETLDVETKEIIEDLYIQEVSLRKACVKFGYSKSGIAYKRDKTIELLEILFKEKYY